MGAAPKIFWTGPNVVIGGLLFGFGIVIAGGGDWGGMNGVDESALPVTMKVDYVRVFQKK
jgi:hypothetical protein